MSTGTRLIAFAATCATAFASLAGVAPSAASHGRAADADALQGYWRLVGARVQLTGDTAQPFAIVGGMIRFTGDTVVMRDVGNDPAAPLTYTFTLDTLADPRRIDLVGYGDLDGQTWDGVYRLADDTLRLTLPVEHHGGAHPERPAGFSGPNTVAMTLRRVQPPPLFPYAGFGRAGCYAGEGLTRMAANGAAPSADAATTGPWLVLDSVSAAEDRAANGDASRVAPEGSRSGTLIERADSLERTFGAWERIAPDSIIFREGSVFPAVDWHLRITPDGLVGEGVLVSDAVSGDRNGVEHTSVMRWPVRVTRIPCGAVPTAQFTNP